MLAQPDPWHVNTSCPFQPLISHVDRGRICGWTPLQVTRPAVCSDCKAPKLFTKMSAPHKTPGRPPGQRSGPAGVPVAAAASLPPRTGSARISGTAHCNGSRRQCSHLEIKRRLLMAYGSAPGHSASGQQFRNSSWKLVCACPSVVVSELQTALQRSERISPERGSCGCRSPLGVPELSAAPGSCEGTGESMWSLAFPLARPRSPRPQERNEIE